MTLTRSQTTACAATSGPRSRDAIRKEEEDEEAIGKEEERSVVEREDEEGEAEATEEEGQLGEFEFIYFLAQI